MWLQKKELCSCHLHIYSNTMSHRRKDTEEITFLANIFSFSLCQWQERGAEKLAPLFFPLVEMRKMSLLFAFCFLSECKKWYNNPSIENWYKRKSIINVGNPWIFLLFSWDRFMVLRHTSFHWPHRPHHHHTHKQVLGFLSQKGRTAHLQWICKE